MKNTLQLTDQLKDNNNGSAPETIYRLLLDDYSTASFVSGVKTYFGTFKDIDGLFGYLRSDKNLAEDYENVLKAYYKSLSVENRIAKNVTHHEVPFLAQAKVLKTEAASLTNYEWEHRNTWRWPYIMRCDEANTIHLWLSCQGKYYRCIRANFTNLQYRTESDEYRQIGDMFWGYPGQIIVKNGNIENRLFVIEKQFTSKTEALTDHIGFSVKANPIFNSVLEDIFGNG